MDVPKSKIVAPLPEANADGSTAASGDPDTVNLLKAILSQTEVSVCIVVDSKGEIVYSHGRTGRFLELAEGEASNNILKKARPDLRESLIKKTGGSFHECPQFLLKNLEVLKDGNSHRFNLTAKPLAGLHHVRGPLILLVFDEISDPERPQLSLPQNDAGLHNTLDRRRLKGQTQFTQKKPQPAVAEHQFSNDEHDLWQEELHAFQIQTELEVTRRRYNELYEYAPVGYLTLNEKGYIVGSNLRAVELLKIDRSVLINRRFTELIHFDDQDAFYLYVLRLRNFPKHRSCNLRLHRGDGSILHVQLESFHKTKSQAMLNHLFMTMTDITEITNTKQKLAMTNAELENLVQQRTTALQETQVQLLHSEKLAAIGSLAASIAHELNNPLQGVLNVIKGVARRAVLDQEDANLMNIAGKECLRMRTLLQALQDFNRPTSGIRAPMNLHQTLDSVLLLFKKEFASKNIILETHYTDASSILYAVGDQIKQVIMNILSNGVEACHGGGTIIIRTRLEQESIILEIRDNGVGIAPQNQSRIFEPFFTTKAQASGIGLGLSISYGIIKNHNGLIEVKSSSGQGSLFRIKLPIRGKNRD